MAEFEDRAPSLDNYWRAIVLFGQNVASYKFALAASLLELAETGKEFVSLEELADPYSRHLAAHVKASPKQSTSPRSRFLDSCRRFNVGEIDKDSLLNTTVKLGFQNVIDAFHVVNRAEIPKRFFHDERRGRPRGLRLTDELLELRTISQFSNLPIEVEARWKLVEAAWSLGLPTQTVIEYEPSSWALYPVQRRTRRAAITRCRDALNGYQKGRCFYCFDHIEIEPTSLRLADIDHFFPRTLHEQGTGAAEPIDGVWNLVLACRECNRGIDGKAASLPVLPLLDRLHTRNEFLINSHHPLRETLMGQTGANKKARVDFLNTTYSSARAWLIHTWQPTERQEPTF
jgi:5-methylcytosine-specific restriction endonuclease McrA